MFENIFLMSSFLTISLLDSLIGTSQPFSMNDCTKETTYFDNRFKDVYILFFWRAKIVDNKFGFVVLCDNFWAFKKWVMTKCRNCEKPGAAPPVKSVGDEPEKASLINCFVLSLVLNVLDGSFDNKINECRHKQTLFFGNLVTIMSRISFMSDLSTIPAAMISRVTFSRPAYLFTFSSCSVFAPFL